MNTPFISITDFMTREQAYTLLDVYPSELQLTHKLGVGVMTSLKVMLGLDTKWAAAFPKVEHIAEIFPNDKQAFNVLHYVDYDDLTTPVVYQMLVAAGGSRMDAIQLDMIWPKNDDLLCLKRSGKNVILQVGELAMAMCSNNPSYVALKLKSYINSGTVDYVLLDRSMGKGKPARAEILLPYIDAIKALFGNQVGIVIAGGLGPQSLHLLDPILEHYPDISIDAQSKLRPSGNSLDEQIDWDMAAAYYASAQTKLARALTRGT